MSGNLVPRFEHENPLRDPQMSRSVDPGVVADASPSPAVGGESPLSIALISPAWPVAAFANGIITYVATIADEMRAAGHTVTVLSGDTRCDVDGVDVRATRPFERPRSLANRLIDAACFKVNFDLAMRRVVVRAWVEECRRLIEHRGLQVVEVEESHGWSSWLQRQLPVPVVTRLHGPWFLNGALSAPQDARFDRQVRREGRAIAEARAVTSPSLDVLERVRGRYGLPLADAEVIPCPSPSVPPEQRWRPQPEGHEVVLFVGRFDRHKGGDVMIRAFAEVAARRPLARLHFVGPQVGIDDGSGRLLGTLEYMQVHIPEHVASGRAHYFGPTPSSELLAHRQGATVSVISSRYETFGLTLVESMMTGCPTVATRAGAFPEILTDGVNGLICENDDPADLADKICRLLEDRDLAARLGRQAALDAERRFSPAVVARQTEAYYRRVIAAWNAR